MLGRSAVPSRLRLVCVPRPLRRRPRINETERIFERANQVSAYFLKSLLSLQGIPIFTDIPGYMMIGCLRDAPTRSPSASTRHLDDELVRDQAA